ncbi:hypothetical protein TNCV_424152 [Trichonephila clavipes]|nr:hypothetical protein TNCV_424152 [Trichonephila clavipes]
MLDRSNDMLDMSNEMEVLVRGPPHSNLGDDSQIHGLDGSDRLLTDRTIDRQIHGLDGFKVSDYVENVIFGQKSLSKKIDLIQLARDLDESPDPSMSKIVLKNLIISSKYYKEEEAKELLEVITAERLETEQQQKLEQQEQLSIEKLRLEIELSRNANQSATQNNGQTV